MNEFNNNVLVNYFSNTTVNSNLNNYCGHTRSLSSLFGRGKRTLQAYEQLEGKKYQRERKYN